MNAEGARIFSESLRQTDRAILHFNVQQSSVWNSVFLKGNIYVGILQTFQDTLLPIVAKINEYLSNYILIILLLGMGILFTIKTRFVQIRCFGEGMKCVFGNIKFRGGKHGGGMSSFQALATAIAAQVGTGNIIGACGAILIAANKQRKLEKKLAKKAK